MRRRRYVRRRLGALAAVAVLAIVAVLVVQRVLDLVGVDEHGADVETVTIDSRAVGRDLDTTVVVPAAVKDAARPPLLVFLHGRGGDERSELDEAFFAALADVGDRAPIVAMPDGGDASYWHDRRDGAWGRYVTREVIPQVVRRYGTDPHRVAIGGISMGGFGAYDIARLHPRRFCAVGGHSPAIWRTGGETAPGAFDDAADFARHDLVASASTGAASFSAPRLWLDAGDRDPFQPGDKAFVAALWASGVRPIVRTWPGGHDDSYWNAHWPSYAAFYARALAHCGR